MSAGKWTLFQIDPNVAKALGMVRHRGIWFHPSDIPEYEKWLIKMEKERVAEEQQTRTDQFRGIEQRLAYFLDLLAGMPASIRSAMSQDIDGIRRDLDAATSGTDEHSVESLTARMADLEASAHRRQLAAIEVERRELAAREERVEVRARIHQAIDALRSTIRPREAGIFCPGLIERADQERSDLLAQPDPDPAEVQGVLERYQDLSRSIARGIQEREEQRLTAHAALVRAEARLADYRQLRGSLPDRAQTFEQAIHPLRSRFDQGAYQDLAAVILDLERTIIQECAQVLTTASRTALQTAVADALTSSLAEAGFAVDRTTALDGTLVLAADRLTGEGMTIQVPISGPARYDLSGFPVRDDADADGRAVTTCDEAEAEILRLHDHLASMGILAGPLRWEGQDPDRIKKSARDLRAMNHRDTEA